MYLSRLDLAETNDLEVMLLQGIMTCLFYDLNTTL